MVVGLWGPPVWKNTVPEIRATTLAKRHHRRQEFIGTALCLQRTSTTLTAKLGGTLIRTIKDGQENKATTRRQHCGA
jgi:hypothetical protein